MNATAVSAVAFCVLIKIYSTTKNSTKGKQKTPNMKHRLILLFTMTALALSLRAQIIGTPQMMVQNLPDEIEETSGAIYHNGKLWTHNDSGNSAVIFSIDTVTGEIIDRKYISGVSKNDWEDMAKSPTHLFIGDIGNNMTGKRTNQKIHRIKWEDLENPNLDTVTARSISFKFNSAYYPESDAGKNNTKFDCEAMMVMNDTIYLFTKNWRDNDCYVYAIPNKANYTWTTLYPIDTIQLDYMVTGADYDYATNSVALCGYTYDNSSTIPTSNPFITIFYGFTGHDFDSGIVETKEYTSPSSLIFQSTGITYNQIEGITFRDSGRLWITNEKYIKTIQGIQAVTIPAHLREIPLNGLPIVNTDEEPSYPEEPPAIVINFEASDTLILRGQSVNFTESCTQNPTAYRWTFTRGTPSSSTLQTPPAITYNTAGRFNVSLRATNDNCQLTKTKSKYIHVLDTATAVFSSNVMAACVNEPVEYYDNSLGAYEIEWYFEGGNPETSTEANPIVMYENPGLYGVTMVVNNPLSTDTITIENYIQVVPHSEANIIALQGMDVAQGESLMFATEPGEGNEVWWHWEFEGGTPATSEEQFPMVTYEEPGTYSISLTTDNGTCEQTTLLEQAVTVYPPISASFTADIDTLCAGYEVHFEGTGEGVTAYNWMFVGGTPESSTEQNPIVTYNTPGTYNVVLIATNPVDTTIVVMENYIEVVPRVRTELIMLPEGEFATVGDTVTFNNASVNATSWMWTFEGGSPNTSTEENPSITYNRPGEYGLTLVASNEFCVGEQVEYSITVYPQIEFSFTADTTKVCAGGEIRFRSTNNLGAVTYRHWEFEGGTPEISDEQNPNITYNEPGTYRVSLQVMNPATSKYMAIDSMITVYPAAIADFAISDSTIAVGGQVTFTSQCSNADRIEWVFAGGNPSVSTELNPTIQYNTIGTFWVSLQAWNEHCNDRVIIENLIEVTDSTSQGGSEGIDEITSRFSVFPNPTSGTLNIDNSGFPYSYTICAQTGAMLIESDEHIEDISTIDVSALPAGNYNLIITTENGTKTFKFIKL